MTPREINEVIAEKWMGFVRCDVTPFWRDVTRKRVFPVSGEGSWDPYHNISHAMMALEKILEDPDKMIVCTLHWDWHYGGWQFIHRAYDELLNPDYEWPWADTPQAAISLALVEAGKEEP